jgi:heme exporter protein A
VSVALEADRGVATATIAAREVGHRFDRGVGLARLSFELSGPGVVAVTGPNGAGKSTLLRVLAGLLRPSEGTSELRVAGRVIAPAERRREVGYLSPELSFYEELTVRENLEFVASARGLAGGGPAAALERVGLAARAHDRAGALSSGLMQRLRLAFALMHQPAMLLLDEPGSHLDDEGRALLFGVLEQEGRRALVVVATNDEREWRRAEQRIELRGRGLGHPA